MSPCQCDDSISFAKEKHADLKNEKHVDAMQLQSSDVRPRPPHTETLRTVPNPIPRTE